MLISLHWLRDFVDVPEDVDARKLAERLTLTTAEVEEVTHIRPGDRTAGETAATLEDWVIEIDNKSITHRPDLWGHYGIAREVAAMLELPLRPLEVADGDVLDDERLPEIPIEIDDPKACPRYSGLMLEGLKPQASPQVMQSRLAHVGMRPINALVDLTNYVMAELGQPMHAFDGDQVDRIEVAVSPGGEAFVTLDGTTRTMPAGAVMIQSHRKNVALAGIMGGLETEVKGTTKRLLLESANFDAPRIRRCGAALGHRTEASARFEKSLDPALTVLAIARFVHLARQQFADLKLVSRLSDCFPNPPKPLSVTIDPAFIADFIGETIPLARMKQILEALEFKVADREEHIAVLVPSFRATKDIECEADIIEEIARFVGYGNIQPVLPKVTVRDFEPNAIHRVERRTLQLLCFSEGYHEIHDYNWYHRDWLRQLGYEPDDSIMLRNPAAAGLERLRRSLVPGLLRAADLNRRELPTLKVINIGSVFFPSGNGSDHVEDCQQRHLGLLSMTRGKKAEDGLLEELKGSVGKWSRAMFDADPQFSAVDAPQYPWEHPQKSAVIMIGSQRMGRISAVPIDVRRRIDEHFSAWSMVVAEINLTAACDLKPEVRPLQAIPEHPLVDLDFSVLIDTSRTYQQLCRRLTEFRHPLLQRVSFEGSYEGRNLPAGKRSILLRLRIGDPGRTLGDEDIKGFSAQFEKFLTANDLELRK